MTFAQALHRVLELYFGDAAFERRDREHIEKIREGLRDEVWNEVFEEAWREVPEELRLRISDDGRDRIRQRIMARRQPTTRSIDATAA